MRRRTKTNNRRSVKPLKGLVAMAAAGRGPTNVQSNGREALNGEQAAGSSSSSIKSNLQASKPPQKCTPAQNLYPPRLNGRFAKICTPFSRVLARRTRTNPEYSFHTTATVTHLKNKAIVVCFLTLETPVEAWAGI